jgi:hypothetical protein
MKRLIPWILGIGVIGGGYLFYRKKAAAKVASTADLVAAKQTIATTAAMDEVNIPIDKRMSQAEKDTYAFQFVYQDPAALLQSANALRGKGYTKVAEGFVNQSTTKAAKK